MMLKRPKARALDRDGAAEIGITALTFLAGDDDRLARFIELTGIAAGDLVAGAREPEILAAIVEYIASDESLLLMFAADARLPPEQVGAALHLLGSSR